MWLEATWIFGFRGFLRWLDRASFSDGQLIEATAAPVGHVHVPRLSPPNPRCAVSSVIRRRASSRSPGAQKNGLRVLRANSFGLVRPAYTAGSRSAVRRHAHLPGD